MLQPVQNVPVTHSGIKNALLISMPFYSLRTPSLQISLLASIARERGFVVDTLHLNLDFASLIGFELYEALCHHRGPEIGNWLFSIAAFFDEAPDSEARFTQEFPEVREAMLEFGLDARALVSIRDQVVPTFLNKAMGQTDWQSYQVVGFSCTFQQNTASFALAKRIKERFPAVVTLFGGANFEGAMGREFVRGVSCIDYAIQGEADEAFPQFLETLTQGGLPQTVSGVISRHAPNAIEAQPFERLDALPVPNFDEFFDRAAALGLIPTSDQSSWALPFESSRGCWWGQKHHCTFCGLNGQTMVFRQKSSARLLDELATQNKRHGVNKFTAVDNIMPMSFFNDLIPRIISDSIDYDLFYEVKSNLTRPQVEALSLAGIRSIQPGIESLSSHVLHLMDKGVSAAQNVNLLRWNNYYGVDVVWNLLWGFPGETKEDYEMQLALIPHLAHLQPPDSANRLWLERFSPLYNDRSRFPVKDIVPERSLRFVYPKHLSLNEVAYFFDHVFYDELDEAFFDPIVQAVDNWKEAWSRTVRPRLIYRQSPGRLEIEDGRSPSSPKLYSLDTPLSEIYALISERPLSAGHIKQSLGLVDNTEDIASALDLFVHKGLVMRDQSLFLALALPEVQGQ